MSDPLVLTKAQSRIWRVMVKQRSYRDNVVALSQTEIASLAGVRSETVCRALRELRHLGAVKKRGPARWMVNPLIAWTGTEGAMLAALRAYEKLGGPKLVLMPMRDARSVGAEQQREERAACW